MAARERWKSFGRWFFVPILVAMVAGAYSVADALVPATFIREDAAYARNNTRQWLHVYAPGEDGPPHELSSSSGFAPDWLINSETYSFQNGQNTSILWYWSMGWGDGSSMSFAPYGPDWRTTHAFSVPTWPGADTYQVSYTETVENLQNGSQWTRSQGSFDILSLPVPQITLRATSPNVYGSTLSGFVSSDGVLDRPLVLIEGMDEQNARWPSEFFGFLQPMAQSALDAAGFDVFVYNYANGNIDIRENAMGALGAILAINDMSTGAYPTRTIGVSMGGVVLRYALAWAEENGVDHGSDMFISLDSPQQGAWVNLALQNWIVNNDDGSNPSLTKLASLLKSPAAKQLLRCNAFDGAGGPPPIEFEISGTPTYMAFYNELNALNGNGYPDETQNIGVSNARGDLSVPVIAESQFGTWIGSQDLISLDVGGALQLPLVKYELGDVLPGSYQPAYRNDVNASGRLNFLEGVDLPWIAAFLLGDFELTLDWEFTLHAPGGASFIWANSALDLWDVDWDLNPNKNNILGWAESKFDRIYLAPMQISGQDMNLFHDEVPMETINAIVAELLSPPPPPPPPPPPGCPYAYVNDGTSFVEQNTVLARVREADAGRQESDVRDAFILTTSPADIDGTYEIELREFEQEHTYLDYAGLLAFDHPVESVFAVHADGSFFLRDEALAVPISATDRRGRDVLKLLLDADGVGFEGHAGDVIDLVFDARDIGALMPLVARTKHKTNPAEPEPPRLAGNETPTSGIEVTRRVAGTDRYERIGVLHPRELSSDQSVGDDGVLARALAPEEGTVDIRLTWYSRHDLDRIGWAKPFEDRGMEVHVVPFASATWSSASSSHVLATDVSHAISAAETDYAELAPGERLTLAFEALPEADGNRTFVLDLEGHYVRLAESVVAEAVYGVLDNSPNPFNPHTTISFSLPEATTVSLRIFGADGRLVRSLASEELGMGDHALAWDGRDDAGRDVGSGVYFYTLASEFGSATRKMALLR